MKKIMISCFTILLQIYTYGQSSLDPRSYSSNPEENKAFYLEQIENVKNNSEFVFEGIKQESDCYPRIDKNGYPYCAISTIFKITKVLRGNLKLGTVEIIKRTNSYMPDQRENIKIPVDSDYIVFCKATDEYPYDTKYNIYPVDNKKILTPSSDLVDCFINPLDGRFFEKWLRSKAEVYRNISALPNINKSVITMEDTTIQVSDHVFYSRTTTKAQIDSARREEELKKKSTNNHN
jgi:hypothetical protein